MKRKGSMSQRGKGASVIFLVAMTAALALAHLAAAMSPFREKSFVIVGESLLGPGTTHRYQRPTGFRLNSEDSSIVFEHLRWREWGAKHTIAHGHAKTCGSGGSEGYVCHSGRVKLEAGARRTCGDVGFYEHLVAYGVPDYGNRLEIPISLAEC
jgi:hypothetical protein